mgnify:CR=1 FL=1
MKSHAALDSMTRLRRPEVETVRAISSRPVEAEAELTLLCPGPVTTSQAVYVSSPASVLFGATLFGERIDVWLIACLGLLLVALYLNNRALSAAKRVSAAAT